MKVKFLGAAGTVTGSSYLLTSASGASVLIDCGLFQGDDAIENQNFTPLDCDCAALSAVIVTHAHLDHCGRLPLLPPKGFAGKIWMTPPTRDITEISLDDTAKINTKEEGAKRALYGREQVDEVLPTFQTVDYNIPFIVSDFEVEFFDAGHILGSASVVITDKGAEGEGKRIVFSGDLGNSPQDLIRATAIIPQADVVVMESTYGDRSHPEGDTKSVLKDEINAVEKSGGALLVPAFSIERTQEILHLINHLKRDQQVKAETPVFVDSPMADKVSQVFTRYPQYFNAEFAREFSGGQPFEFPGLNVIPDIEASRQVDAATGAKVIIAGSGMLTGGRILNHALTYLPKETTRLVFTGYQAQHTLGRQILEGNKEVRINETAVSVAAHIGSIETLSSHADQPKLLAWLKAIKGVRRVFLTHGDDEARAGLKAKIASDLKLTSVETPIVNQEFEL